MGIRDFLRPRESARSIRQILAETTASNIGEYLARSARLRRSDDGEEPTQGPSEDGQHGYARDGMPHGWRRCPHCGSRLVKATSDRQQERESGEALRAVRQIESVLRDDKEHERAELQRSGWGLGSGSRAGFHATKRAGDLTAHVRGDGGPNGPHTVTIHDAAGKVHDSSHGSRAEAMRTAGRMLSERAGTRRLQRSEPVGWRPVGAGAGQRHVLTHPSGASATIRPGYGSEHHLIVNHGNGRVTNTSHPDLGAAMAHGERLLRRSERYSEDDRARVRRRKEAEYGQDEVFAVPGLHSYPLTKDGKPDHERVQAAWDYLHTRRDSGKLSPSVVSGAKRRIRAFARKHFPDMELEDRSPAA